MKRIVADILAAAGLAVVLAALPACGRAGARGNGADVPVVAPAVKLVAPAVKDQDDMCLWVHPTDPAQSTVIASDKAAGRLFVYDLAGKLVQAIETPMPGNIDLRRGFPLGGKTVDLVALNQRADGFRLVVFAVDPATRQLRRVDDGRIETGPNYGGTLYRSPKTGKVYFITTSMPGRCEQYELADDGTGRVAGRKVRQWDVGYAEAAVADDARGKVYIAEEARGIFEIGGDPDDPAPGRWVIRTGASGLVADVEGLAIHPRVAGGPALVVSNQSRNQFKVYRLGGDFALLGTFAVAGARDTDGVDLTAADLGPPFAKGLFACHTDTPPRPVLLVPWDRIAEALGRAAKAPPTPDTKEMP